MALNFQLKNPTHFPISSNSIYNTYKMTDIPLSLNDIENLSDDDNEYYNEQCGIVYDEDEEDYEEDEDNDIIYYDNEEKNIVTNVIEKNRKINLDYNRQEEIRRIQLEREEEIRKLENLKRLEEDNKRRIDEEKKRKIYEEENKRRLEENKKIYENKKRLEEERKMRIEEENKKINKEDIKKKDLLEKKKEEDSKIFKLNQSIQEIQNTQNIKNISNLQNIKKMNNIHNLEELEEELENTDEETEDIDYEYNLSNKNPEFVDFTNKVKEWLMLDDDIKTLTKAASERRKKKNEMTPEILNFMNKYDIQDLNTKDGKLQYAKSTITKPMNKEYLRNRLSDFFRNIKKAEDCTNYLLENRIKEEKIRLRRVSNRGKKKLDLTE